jgi:hypothetical protein
MTQNITNDYLIKQMATEYVPIPNGHERYVKLQLQGLAKYTEIGGLGLKTNHLATLVLGDQCSKTGPMCDKEGSCACVQIISPQTF